jgi:hypothetical protein
MLGNGRVVMNSFSRLMGFLVLQLAFSVSAHAALTDGLQLYYSFDVNGGGVVADDSGHGHAGAIFGAQYTTEGISGGAYRFDGSNDWIEAGDIFDLAGSTTQLTVCAWINASLRPFEWQIIVCKEQQTGPDSGWVLYVSPYNWAFSQLVATWPQQGAADGTTVVSDEQWHFVCATYEAYPSLLRCTIYVDGVLQDVSEWVGAHGSTEASTPLTIGLREPMPGGLSPFKGTIDEVRIYNRILSNNEIAELYDADKPAEPGDERYVTTIGYSNDPEGDQDVTEFYRDETLYVRVRDVDLEADDYVSLRMLLQQPRSGMRMLNLERQADGSFAGSIPLRYFRPGMVRVFLQSNGRTLLMKESAFTILAD